MMPTPWQEAIQLMRSTPLRENQFLRIRLVAGDLWIVLQEVWDGSQFYVTRILEGYRLSMMQRHGQLIALDSILCQLQEAMKIQTFGMKYGRKVTRLEPRLIVPNCIHCGGLWSHGELCPDRDKKEVQR